MGLAALAWFRRDARAAAVAAYRQAATTAATTALLIAYGWRVEVWPTVRAVMLLHMRAILLSPA